MSYRYYGAPIIKYEGNRARMVLRGLGDPVVEDLKRARFRNALARRFGSAAVHRALGNDAEEVSVEMLSKLGIDESQAAQFVNAISDFGGALLEGKNLIDSGKAMETEPISQTVVVTLMIGGIGLCGALGALADTVTAGAATALVPLCAAGMMAILEAIPFDKVIGPVVGAVWTIIQGVGKGIEDLFNGRFEDAFNDVVNAIGKAWDQLVMGVTGPDWDKYHRESWNASAKMMHSLTEMAAVVGLQERTAVITVMRLHNQLEQSADGSDIWDYNKAKDYFESRYFANMDAYPKNAKGQYIIGPGIKATYNHAGFIPYGGFRKILPLHKRAGAVTSNWNYRFLGTLWPRTTDPEMPDPSTSGMRQVEYTDPDRVAHHSEYYVPFGWLDQVFDQNYSGYPGIGDNCSNSYCEGGAPVGRPKDGPEYFKPMAHVLLLNGGWGSQGVNASINRIAGPFQAYTLDLNQRKSDISLALLFIQKEFVNQYADKISKVKSAYASSVYAKSLYTRSVYALRVKEIASEATAAAAATSQKRLLTVAVILAAGGLAYYFYRKKRK